MTGFILFAHGSTVKEANDGVRAVTAEVARGISFDLVETAFLDCAPPDLASAVASLAAAGATRIVVVPFFLTLGIHLQRDLPAIVDRLRGSHKSLTIEVTPPLEGHPALTRIVLDRAAAALKERAVERQAG
jgi:sirohydrochlorin ferrochelatase